jgi:hypothetical protein
MLPRQSAAERLPNSSYYPSGALPPRTRTGDPERLRSSGRRPTYASMGHVILCAAAPRGRTQVVDDRLKIPLDASSVRA